MFLFVSDRKTNRRVQSGESGSSLIEFVLCFALFWVPFFFGMWRVGISLIRTIQVTEVCRDAAHMLAYGIDFSDTGNQAILQKVAQGIDISSSGQAVVILSNITYVDSGDCSDYGVSASNCANVNQYVITKRLVIGNTSVRSSAFGTPKSGDPDDQGDIDPGVYLTDTTCRASSFSNLMTLSSGQYAFVAEMTLNSTDLGNRASSARSIF